MKKCLVIRKKSTHEIVDVIEFDNLEDLGGVGHDGSKYYSKVEDINPNKRNIGAAKK